MKYLFVIYTDIEYKQHLDNFKSQEFYRKICDDPTIEVIEWGADFHTDYKDLPIKTQEMMKWCSENKEYDYLIKCDDTIFDDKWVHYRDRLVYENIFKSDDIEYLSSNFIAWDITVQSNVTGTTTIDFSLDEINTFDPNYQVYILFEDIY